MQHQMAPRTQRRNRTRLFGLARSDRLAQSQHRARQIKVDGFFGQHGQALQYTRRRCMRRVGQIVVNHGRMISVVCLT
jgi:hypothetical protein